MTYSPINFMFKRIARILCRVDDSQWDKFPDKGPLLLVANHINFLEVPVMYSHLFPRPITGFVKVDHWENPLLRWLLKLWGGIPLRRDEADLSAMRAGIAALAAGKILCVAPEGTRTGDGHLIKGHPGITFIALKTNAPILPVAYIGGEHFWSNLRRLRRTEFTIRVGRPFYLEAPGQRITKEVRQQMTDEIMFQIARLLPHDYRGYYADISAATETHLRFERG
jgi:1-acyl-sn-glycerol-3-phosphate acyltransferase